MEHGILGSVRPEVQDIRSIVKSGDFEKQSKFLQHATPEEIGHAINHGFIDYAADDFSGDFINTLSKVVVTYEKNITNI